jgi:hypothetical protein
LEMSCPVLHFPSPRFLVRFLRSNATFAQSYDDLVAGYCWTGTAAIHIIDARDAAAFIALAKGVGSMRLFVSLRIYFKGDTKLC